MGMECELKQLFSFIYKAELDKGLTEHELDHVVLGLSDDKPAINPEEVEDWKYVALDDLKKDIQLEPTRYTEWFKIVLDRFIDEHHSF
jgi:isopentenyl-diphosphate delta-isomerase